MTKIYQENFFISNYFLQIFESLFYFKFYKPNFLIIIYVIKF